MSKTYKQRLKELKYAYDSLHSRYLAQLQSDVINIEQLNNLYNSYTILKSGLNAIHHMIKNDRLNSNNISVKSNIEMIVEEVLEQGGKIE